ncbi:alpha-xenorhabdolysin family binary toxin subunit A [Pseudomonas plecoglossicida]|uniref:alpha-xenorhabdolysin family binary toxin subunit A n=1 Tax=Pseudomonas plecoglossicida TaxID=70775 RepID=UPI0015E318EB|nr:alpha-xenorhabdolysin family binary toxin subunit A [Pseudomonas plecoglossicida]MBA1198041.1 alpha-xenorhabdolysin family binary toxin subunit A [Pseudomonas plecoglossicida]
MDVMENPSLATLDAQQQAELVPKQYFQAISDTELTDSQPALIFSRENLLVIKRYVRTVKALPSNREVLDSWLDFELFNLKVDEVHGVFEDLRKHVQGWDPLEGETQAMGTTLENFAATFTAEGAELTGIARSMSAYRGRPLGDVSDELLEAWTPAALDLGEKTNVFPSIEDLLLDLQEQIDRVDADIKRLCARAGRFYNDVEEILLPKIGGLEADLGKITRDAVIIRITDAMDALDAEIDVKSAEISGFSAYQFFGMIFGAAGAVVTHAIFGSEARAAKESRNALLRQRDELGRNLDQVSPQLAELKNLVGIMVDMKERLRHVNTAAWNLQWVLRSLGNHIALSKQSLADLDTDVKFERFIRRFERVVRPWHMIGNISAELTQVFNDVVKNYDEE